MGIDVQADWSFGPPSITTEHNLDSNSMDYPYPPDNPTLEGATVGGVFVPMGSSDCVFMQDNQVPPKTHCICVSVYIDPVTGCPHIHLAACEIDPRCTECMSPALSAR